MGVSFLVPSHALKVIPIGTAYAVWTGIGAVGWLFWEWSCLANLETRFVFCVFWLIVGGIAGLKYSSSV